MNSRFYFLVVGALFLVGALFVVVNAMQGLTFETAFKISLVLAPLLLITVTQLRPFYTPILLSLTLFGTGLPVPLFDRINPLFAIGCVAILVDLGDYIIRRNEHRVISNWWSVGFIYLGVIALAWLIIQRPGSARLGGTGGLGESSRYALAIPLYITVARSAASMDVPRNRRLWTGLAVVAAVAGLIQIFAEVGGRWSLFLFEKPIWMLYPILLGGMLEKESRGSKAAMLLRFTLVLAVGLMAVFSAFRSRIIFFLAATLGVHLIYRRGGRIMLMLLLALAAFIIGVLTVKGEVPARLARPLSLFVSSAELRTEDARRLEVSPEMGWSSEFRFKMTQIAWEQMKRNPIFGRGNAYTFAEIFSLFSAVGETGMSILALAGGYHNAVLTIGVFYGIPAALAFCSGYLALLVRFIRRMRDSFDPELRPVGAALTGFAAPLSGQFLMNGAGFDMLSLCVLLGAMNGILQRQPQLTAVPAPAASAALTPRTGP